jgi:hypothetical protein
LCIYILSDTKKELHKTQQGEMIMAKRINISVPDEMFAKLTELKDELSDGQVKGNTISRKVSSVCQKALTELLVEAEVSRVYRLEGIKDGKNAAGSLSVKDKNFIIKVLSGEGPYKKWSRFERVNVVLDHFGNDRSYAFISPRFTDLMDGKSILHDWVICDDQLKAEDRRGEMAWSYLEGCFEGIVLAIANENKNIKKEDI